MTEPRIVTKEEFKVVGVAKRVQIDSDQAMQLWQGFIKRIGDIKNKLKPNVSYSICKYDPNFSIQDMSEHTQLDIMACVEVDSLDNIPQGMTSKKIPTQKYAVFTTGDRSSAYEYIYGDWAYNSGYELAEADDFECYDESYNPDDPKHCQFDIYIPIK